MMRALSIAVTATLVAAAGACYPDRISDQGSPDVVATQFDSTANFHSIGTFGLPDSVVHFIQAGQADTISRQYDAAILQRVRQDLTQLGYVEDTDPIASPPDVVAQVAAIATGSFKYLSYDWWSYWSWYWNPWDPTYGPDWGFIYPPHVVTYAYPAGTVLVAMLDRRSQNPTARQIPVIWSAALVGRLSGSEADLGSRIAAAIDRAFAQSPYLGRP
jgi:hypothetical protein